MEILTSKSLYETEAYKHGDDLSAFWEEQNIILESIGYRPDAEYVIKFGNCESEVITTIDEAIQCLALKDGCDLVRFKDGCVGFVGYYNGFDLAKNNFRIIKKAS